MDVLVGSVSLQLLRPLVSQLSDLWGPGFDSRYGLMTLMWKQSRSQSMPVRGLCSGMSQSTLCRKSWVSSGYSSFLPQGMLTAWVGINWPSRPNWPSQRSCAPWSDMSHKVAARGAFRKPSTQSGWASSFVIELKSQLQVRMITPPTSLLTLTLIL
jgi:hypothetical protein